MRRLLATMTCGVLLGGLLIAAPATAGFASDPAGRPAPPKAEEKHAVQSDVSAPLSSIPPAHRIPRNTHGDSPMPTPTGPVVTDPVVQSSPLGSAAPATSTNFDGVAANGSAPPDPNGAVGPNHYFDLVNTELQIFDKSGGSKLGPEPTYTIWSGFGGECASENDGDGVVRYDALADRWVVSQFALGPSGNGPFYQCIAVSTTADPTGSYYRYSFSFGNFPDYPKMGVWPDAYYQTMNMFSSTNSFLGPTTCAYNRSLLLAGQAGVAQCYQLSPIYGSMLPGDLDGVIPPPAGEANTQIALGTDNTHLASWRFHVDWGNSTNTTLTPTSIPVAAYAGACGGGGTCIPQPGTSQQLDSLADRLMYRFAYRNLGGHESWVVTYSVAAGAGAAPRWFELQAIPAGASSLTVTQDSTYVPDTTAYRWMGSAAMDSAGDIALGYSVSSGTVKPEIAYTGRLSSDPINTMGSETVLYQGGGVQTGNNLSRWGDYTAMTVDPSDGCTFWYTNEYLPSNGSFNWHTRIGAFAFPTTACAPRTDNDFSLALMPVSGSVTVSGTAATTVSTGRTAGSAESVALSTGALPAGVTASFSANSVTAGGSSTLTFTVTSTAAAGTYPITVTGTATSGSHSSTYTLTVSPPPSPTIVNGGFEAGTLSNWTSTGTTAVSTASVHGGTYSALVGSTSTPTSGDSSISQTFQPAAASTLSFWYRVVCPDTVTYDWATATLTDATANTTTTLLAKTCTNSGSWVNVSSAIGSGSVGHLLTLTLTSHDDNYATDPTGTYFDDVSLSSAGPDFTLSASPSSRAVAPGGATTYTVTVGATNGFSGTVSLSTTGQPSTSTPSFNPAAVIGSGTSTLTVTTSSSTTPGSYGITITGTSGSLTHTSAVTLIVQAPDFSLSATPTSQTVHKGSPASYTVTVTSVAGFTGTVIFSASGLPSGAVATFTPTSVTGSGSTALTISTTSASPSRTVTITGTAGSLVHTTNVTLTITRH